MMNLGIPIPQRIPKVNCFSVAQIESANPVRSSPTAPTSITVNIIKPQKFIQYGSRPRIVYCAIFDHLRIDRRMGKLEPKLGQQSASIGRSIRLRLRLKDRNLLGVL